MRTLTNTELNQLAGGLQKAKKNDTVKPIATGLGIGIFLGFFVQGKGWVRSSGAAAVAIGCCYLVNETVLYCASFLPSSKT